MLALVSLTLPSAALEQRAFHSVDKTKLFYGLLTDYNPAKKSVTVRMKNGQFKQFKISLLSEEDQEYVLASQGELAVNQGLRVSFKEVKDKSTRTKKGLIRTSTVPTYFDVTVYNRSKTPIEGLKLRYSYYYCIGTLTSGGPKHSPQVAKGVLAFTKIFGQDTSTLQTAKIDIMRASKKGVAPPAPSGGGGGGGG